MSALIRSYWGEAALFPTFFYLKTNTTMIFKGILLWFTAVFILLFIAAVDSMSIGQILTGASLCIILLFVCKHKLTMKDIDILSGSNLFRKWL